MAEKEDWNSGVSGSDGVFFSLARWCGSAGEEAGTWGSGGGELTVGWQRRPRFPGEKLQWQGKSGGVALEMVDPDAGRRGAAVDLEPRALEMADPAGEGGEADPVMIDAAYRMWRRREVDLEVAGQDRIWSDLGGQRCRQIGGLRCWVWPIVGGDWRPLSNGDDTGEGCGNTGQGDGQARWHAGAGRGEQSVQWHSGAGRGERWMHGSTVSGKGRRRGRRRRIEVEDEEEGDGEGVPLMGSPKDDVYPSRAPRMVVVFPSRDPQGAAVKKFQSRVSSSSSILHVLQAHPTTLYIRVWGYQYKSTNLA